MISTLFTQHYPPNSAAFAQLVQQNVLNALSEDLVGNSTNLNDLADKTPALELNASGDITAFLIPADKQVTATIITREEAIICGLDWVNACFKHLDKNINLKWLVNEGEKVSANQLLCEINGNARAILSAERTALNFLQSLSAVATVTRQYVLAVSGTQAQILDTRKTIPGLRLAQKYAVTIGGGFNQRLGLYDGILIKENHIAAAGSIDAALQSALKHNQHHQVQIEVENIDQLKQALDAKAVNILLDNFGLNGLRKAVLINQKSYASQGVLEASGGVDVSSARAIALTGVNRISVGSLTKNVRALDLSLKLK